MATQDTATDWAGDARNASPDGEFVRDTTYIEDRISPPSVSEPTAQDDGTFFWPMEAGHYRLVAARACRGHTAPSSPVDSWGGSRTRSRSV